MPQRPHLRRNLLRAFVGLLDDPGKSDALHDAAASAAEAHETSLEQLSAAAFERPEVVALFASGYNPRPHHLLHLVRLPEQTLGRVYADHMNRHGLVVDLLPESLVDDKRLAWLLTRITHLHDVLHVLLDYDTSLAGELAVQGFVLGQFAAPMAGLATGAAIQALAIDRPDQLPVALDLLLEGYQRGKAATPYLSLRWEEHWELPLAEARTLGAIPARAFAQHRLQQRLEVELPGNRPNDRAAAS